MAAGWNSNSRAPSQATAPRSGFPRDSADLEGGGPHDLGSFHAAILRQRVTHTSRDFSFCAMCGNEGIDGPVPHERRSVVFRIGCHEHGAPTELRAAAESKQIL
jgi:hypothetical protein